MDNKFTDYKIFYLQEVEAWVIKDLIKNEESKKTERNNKDSKISLGSDIEIKLSEDKKNISVTKKEDNTKIIGYLSEEDSKAYIPYLKNGHNNIYEGFILEFDKKADQSRMLKILIYITNIQDKAEKDKAEQDKAEKDKAEQDKAEQDKAEQDKAEQDKAEQDKAEQDKVE